MQHFEIARAYVSSLVLQGINSPDEATNDQRRKLLSYLVEDVSDNEFFDLLTQKIDSTLLQQQFISFLRFNRTLERETLLQSLRLNLDSAFVKDMETLFMDEQERNENERLDFNNHNYGSHDPYYI